MASSVDLLLVLAISEIENADSHVYEVENGSKISNAFLFTSSHFAFRKEFDETHKILIFTLYLMISLVNVLFT